MNNLLIFLIILLLFCLFDTKLIFCSILIGWITSNIVANRLNINKITINSDNIRPESPCRQRTCPQWAQSFVGSNEVEVYKLFDNEQPKELFDKNIFIIGHIFGPMILTKFIDKIKAELSDIIIIAVSQLGNTINDMKKKCLDLCDKFKNKPILFIGNNTRNGKQLIFPGFKLYVDIDVCQLMWSLVESNTSNKKIRDQINNSIALNNIYYKTHLPVNESNISTFERVKTGYLNALHKIANRDNIIIHISGQSGSGKTTLQSRLNDGNVIIDADEINDKITLDVEAERDLSADERIVKKEEAKRTYIFANCIRGKVCVVGNTLEILGLADYLYMLNTDSLQIYRQRQSRELNTICDARAELLNILQNSKDINYDLFVHMTKIQNRDLVIKYTTTELPAINGSYRYYEQLGYRPYSADKIVDICNNELKY